MANFAPSEASPRPEIMKRTNLQNGIDSKGVVKKGC